LRKISSCRRPKFLKFWGGFSSLKEKLGVFPPRGFLMGPFSGKLTRFGPGDKFFNPCGTLLGFLY